MVPGTYSIKLKVYPPDDQTKYSISTIEYKILEGDLTLYIENSKRLHGYAQPLVIQGIAKD